MSYDTNDKQLERYQKAMGNMLLNKMEDGIEWKFDLKEAIKAKTFNQFKNELMKYSEFRDIVVMLYGKEVLGVLNKDNKLENFYKKHHVSDETEV